MNEWGKPSLRIAVMGAGRVGAVLGAALGAAGHQIVGVGAVSEASRERAARMLPGVPICDARDLVASCDVALLTVPDDAIGPLVAGLANERLWRPDHVAVHTSGFHGIDVLAPVTAVGGHAIALHPAMTFTGTARDLPRLQGLPVAVTASPGAGVIAEALALEIGADPWYLDDTDRPRYHAALTHGSNHLITLVAQSAQLLRDVGIDDPARLLAPLLGAALDNSLERGDKALTGPVARGDVATVEAHLAQLRGTQDVELAYRALAEATAMRAMRRHTLAPEAGARMLSLFDNDAPRQCPRRHDEDLRDD